VLLAIIGIIIPVLAPKLTRSQPSRQIDQNRTLAKQFPPLSVLFPIGRRRELSRVSQLLKKRTSVVITGIPGVGKSTLLALAVRQIASVENLYTDICYHRIAERDSEEERLERLLLNVILAIDPFATVNSSESATLLVQVRKLTFSRKVLLAIDNADDEASLTTVQTVLDHLPDFTLAVTSRRITWENITVFRLEGMTTTECLELFQATLDKPLDQASNQAVTELCELVKGHPMMMTHLALEANEGNVSLQTLRTQKSLDLTRDLSRRFDSIVSRLPPECHRALNIIGLLDTATVRIDLVSEVGDVSNEKLEQLREQQLIHLQPDHQHFIVHELVHRWCRNKLENERSNVQKRVELEQLQLGIAEFYCAMLKKTGTDAESIRHIDDEWPNILGLIDNLADPAIALKIVDEIIGDHFEDPNGYVPRRKQTTSLIIRSEMLQRYTNEVGGLLAARVEKNLGHFFYWRGDHINAESLFLRARERYKAASDLAGEACCIWLLGYLADDENRYSEAFTLYTKGTELAQRVIPFKSELVAAGHHLIGCTLYHHGHYREAEKEFLHALSLIDKNDTCHLYARIERRLGSLAIEFQNYDEADIRLHNAMELVQRIERPRDAARISRQLGLLYLCRKDLNKAEEMFDQAFRMFRELQAERGIGYTLCGLAGLRLQQNRLGEAKDLSKQSLNIAVSTRSLYGEATAYEQLGKILEAQEAPRSEVNRQYQHAYNLYKLIDHQRAPSLRQLLKARGGIELQFPANFRGVLFDLMDTLAYLNPEVYEEVHQKFANTLGVSAERFHWAWSKSRLQASRGLFTSTAERITWVVAALGVRTSDEQLARMVRQEESMWRDAVKLYEGTVPLLQTIRKLGLRVAIVCNGSIAMACLAEALGLIPLIDSFTISCKVGSTKPERAIYASVIDELKLDWAECVFIGDGNDRELDGARDLGIYTVKVNRPRAPYANLSNESRHWNYEVNDLEELKGLFDSRLHPLQGRNVDPIHNQKSHPNTVRNRS
jgi:putative hydrolase of the HAD superfamily